MSFSGEVKQLSSKIKSFSSGIKTFFEVKPFLQKSRGNHEIHPGIKKIRMTIPRDLFYGIMIPRIGGIIKVYCISHGYIAVRNKLLERDFVMKRISLIFLICAGISRCLAGDIEIDPDNAVIVAVSLKEPAVQELKAHLDLISGMSIPVTTSEGAAKPGAYVFYVGRAPDAVQTAFRPEEARWEITPDAAYFYGDRNGDVRNAVYDFLESELGIRWPAPGIISYRKQDRIRIRNRSGVWCPDLKIRCIRMSRGGPEYLQWRKRLRQGEHDRPRYGHAFTRYWERFGKTHPEFFAMRKDGIRGPANLPGPSANVAAYQGRAEQAVAMCVSNDMLVKQVVADWDKRSEYINICENDAAGKDSCHCSLCQALDVPGEGDSWEENGHSDRYIHFAHRVLEEARKYRPDVKVCLYAYNASEAAPRRERLNENMIFGIVPTLFSMKKIESYVGSWKEAGLKHFFYRPNRHHYYDIPQIPCGFEKHFFEIWQYLYRSGAIGFDYDSPAPSSPPQFFSDYVISKAMQDPSKPFEFWEDHYLQAYGNAADEVRAYFRYWRENIWDARLCPQMDEITEKGRSFNFARGLARNLQEYYTEADFDATDRILEAALKKELTEVERTLVESLKTYNTHARLFFKASPRLNVEDSIRLLEFRRKHGFTLLPENENYWGDICGIRLARDFRDCTPPFIRLPLFWSFRLDPDDLGIKEKWFADSPEKVQHWGDFMPTNTPWESPYRHYPHPSAKTREKTRNYDGFAWYGTTIRIPADWPRRKIFLYFGAVDESCWVYVNGREAGSHVFNKPNDWKSSFTIPVDSTAVGGNGEVTIVVRVEDRAGWGGIWKPVWLVSRTE